MGAQLKIIKRFQRDLLLLQYFPGRPQHEVWMGGQESLNDLLVLFR